VKREIDHAREKLGETGRILVRYSGTEPVARVMVEGQDEREIAALAQSVAEAIRQELG
jgi:phosphoglucosamine mutase